MAMPKTPSQVGDFRFTVRTGRHRIQFGFEHFGLNGDQAVARTFEFNGQVYTVGAEVVTDATINHVVLRWDYAVVRAANGRFRLGPLVEGHGL